MKDQFPIEIPNFHSSCFVNPFPAYSRGFPNNTYRQTIGCLRNSPNLRLRIEATVGIEPTIRVLQTHALPLGHVAILPSIPDKFWSRYENTRKCTRQTLGCQPAFTTGIGK